MNRFFSFLTVILIILFIFFGVMGIELLIALNKFNRLKYDNGLKSLSSEKTDVDFKNSYLMDNGVLLFRVNNRIYFWSDIERKVKRYYLEVPLVWIQAKTKSSGQKISKLLPKYIRYTNLEKIPNKINLASQIIFNLDNQEKVSIVNVYY